MTRFDLTEVSASRRSVRRARPPWRGAGVVTVAVAALLVVRMTAPPEVVELLGASLVDGVTLAISVVIESLPFVILGIGVSTLVQLFVPTSVIMKVLPRTPILRRAVLSITGVLLPVCECGNLPVARGLVTRGLSVGDAVTFLLAAPILNPVTIITTYQAFGWSDGILVWRVIGGFVIANAMGWLFSRHPAPQTLLTGSFQAQCASDPGLPSRGRRTRAAAGIFVHETGSMLPALFVGAAVAGAIQVAVPRELLIALGANPVWSVLALMALAFLIAICSNVDAFFALSLGSSFMPGAIVGFLVFGPMIDVKMIAMMRTTFTTTALVQMTAFVALATLVLGLGVNLLA